MNLGIGLLFAVAIMIGFFTLLMVLFEERNPLLKYLFLMGILVSAFFVPTGVYHLRDYCEIMVANTTVSGNFTGYEYRQECFTTTANDGADTFYSVMWSLYQIMILYFIIRVFVLMFSPLWEKMKRGGL